MSYPADHAPPAQSVAPWPSIFSTSAGLGRPSGAGLPSPVSTGEASSMGVTRPEKKVRVAAASNSPVGKWLCSQEPRTPL